MAASRFFHITFDDESLRKRDEIQEQFKALEKFIKAKLTHQHRGKCLDRLEESHFWALKGLRADQLEREARAEGERSAKSTAPEKEKKFATKRKGNVVTRRPVTEQVSRA